MNIANAFQRLSWRMGNGKFEPNQADIDALKFIAEWVNREKQREIQENSIFAKLYVYCFMHEIDFYKDLDFAQKKMHELLEKHITDHYTEFLKRLNDFELDRFMKEYNLDKDFINKDKILAQETTISETQTKLKELVIGKWSQEQVNQSLNNQISEAINRYKNLP